MSVEEAWVGESMDVWGKRFRRGGRSWLDVGFCVRKSFRIYRGCKWFGFGVVGRSGSRVVVCLVGVCLIVLFEILRGVNSVLVVRLLVGKFKCLG